MEMGKNKNKILPQFKSLDDLAEFFDSHDLGDYLAQYPEVNFDVNIKHKRSIYS